ncbi:hypothetical protein [Devosia sediminis]|uniref:DUF2059 domain-containing protein n=1 Tax=Devosia sediminis TaxID=2798801 RepID=A0A934ISI3_9HYPH|nr:hypothetical protein [Devosia sediminis]MBJ3783502.1 hypothetical protein [Devosia sediminis]
MTSRLLNAAALALAVGAVSSVLAFVITPQSVLALDAGEAEGVISVMEVLTEEFGESMTTDAAESFYDYDSLDSTMLIEEAGFDRDSWIAAYEAVSAGYMAIIPQDQIDAMFAEPLALLDASELPEDQKAEMRRHVEGLMVEMQALRERGQAHADVVRPFESRLAALFAGSFGE